MTLSKNFMPKHPFDNGELRLVILGMIAEQPRHGYELIKAIEERMGGSYSPSPGVIYPTLAYLEEVGHATALVTSRFPLTDLAPMSGRGYRHRDVEGLDAASAGRSLKMKPETAEHRARDLRTQYGVARRIRPPLLQDLLARRCHVNSSVLKPTDLQLDRNRTVRSKLCGLPSR